MYRYLCSANIVSDTIQITCYSFVPDVATEEVVDVKEERLLCSVAIKKVETKDDVTKHIFSTCGKSLHTRGKNVTGETCQTCQHHK